MVKIMIKNDTVSNTLKIQNNQKTYASVRNYIIAAQSQVYKTINSAMVTAYWNIGKQIYEACGNNKRAEYGKQLMAFLEEKLTEEFGKGFSIRNLQMMRQFYLTFPNANALRSELSWTHYRTLMRVSDETIRNFYLEETIKTGWSSRQLSVK